jgi:hypothetical protein
MTMTPSIIFIVFFSGLLTLACCVHSLVDHSKKGQVLSRLWK